MSIRKIFYQLPPGLRFLARRLYHLPEDLLQQLSNKDTIVPPKGMIYTGGGDFVATGQKFANFLVDLCGLEPNGKVLDIGSGIGRVAIPLTKILNSDGRYEGFDVVQKGVNWCQENISVQYPNFKFAHVQLKNDLYNKDGKDASDYRFDYEDESFSHVILVSIFTHFLPEELEQYLFEIERVLEKGQFCLATFFIYKDIKQLTNTSFRFDYPNEHHALMDQKVKAANVAFRYSYLKNICNKSGLEITAFHKGSWSESTPKNHKDFQDILILRKSPI